MPGAQRMVSRRGLLVAGVTAGGAVAASIMPGPPTGGREAGDAASDASASPVATPLVEQIETETVIEVEAVGLRFSPSSFSIPARTPVRILFTNRSRVYHDLTIPGLGRRTRRIGPDETSELMIQAEPGAYDFYCSIQSHHQAGMEGTITAR